MTNKQYEMLIERVYGVWMNRKTKYKCSVIFTDDSIGVTVYEHDANGMLALLIDSYEFRINDTVQEVTQKFPIMQAVLSGRRDPFYQ